MIIYDYVSKEQISDICEIIKKQCESFKKANENLYYEPYTTMRQKHQLTSAVLTGFAPDRCSIEGFVVNDINYGIRGLMALPELSNKNVIIQVYSNNASFNNKLIKNRCEKYNSDLNTLPVFLIVVFNATKEGTLRGIEMRFLNHNADTIECIDLNHSI